MNFFLSNGVRLAYRIDGRDDAPTIVLVNSLGTNMSMWDPQVSFLEHYFHIVRYDCRGHGASDIADKPYTIEELGLDLLALLDALHVERVHICGLSLGGMIAQWFAASHPERVIYAVFANTAACIGSREIWNTRIETVRASGMGEVRDTVLARFLSAEFRQKNPQMVQQIGEMVEATNPRGYIGACEALREGDLRELSGTIHVPSLIIAGGLDQSTPPEQANELHMSIAGSQFMILPRAAHLSNVEFPQEFSDRVLSFLLSA